MDKAKLKGMISEAVGSFYREQAEKDLRKNISEACEEEFGKDVMSKKKFNQLAKAAYKLDAEDKKAELEEIIELLSEIGVE